MLDGVKPSVSSIQNGTYKMVRPMGIVLKKNPDAATRAFADWAKGNEAAKILDSKGYASIK
jgi:phosphate transport system substrate-binding protein